MVDEVNGATNESESKTDELFESKDDTSNQEPKTEEVVEYVPAKLALGKDSFLNEDNLKSISDLSSELKMTQAQAESMLGQSDVAIARYVDKQATDELDLHESWAESVRNDKELGGDNLDKTLSLAKGVVDKYGTDGKLGTFLKESGLGNHPDMIRFLSQLGAATSDDKAVLNGEGQVEEKSQADMLYGSSN